jgi:hypothetical protein
LLKVIGGLLIVTQPPVHSAEAGQRPGFARPASASRYRYDQETPPALRCKRLPRHSASPAAAAGWPSRRPAYRGGPQGGR